MCAKAIIQTTTAEGQVDSERFRREDEIRFRSALAFEIQR